MRRIETELKDAFIIVPDVYKDHRGFFKEIFREEEYRKLGIETRLVQDSVSFSTKGVLRGLHYDFSVTKLVQVVYGQTYHVIADLRPESPTYRRWQAFTLSHENHWELLVPAGFGNGFYVMSDVALVLYKQGTYFNPATERLLRWNDPAIGIRWPTDDPIMSEKDRNTPDYRRP